MAKLILFNKPFGVLSQFSQRCGHPSLADYIDSANVYPAGRLDRDSEGLLLLTDEGKLQHRISHPRHKLPKTYWVQVEGEPDRQAMERLCHGVELRDGWTLPAKARLIDAPPLWPRTPPIRERQRIPTRWLEITITEGRNRQVRRMTAAVGHPTLRLIRVSIGQWTLKGLTPGSYRLETVHVPAPSSTKRSAAKQHRINR